jgi:hypothetical protein
LLYEYTFGENANAEECCSYPSHGS